MAVICTPIGRPSGVNPHGREILGRPAQENGKVKAVSRCVVATMSVLSSASGAGTGAVGQSKTSTVHNALEITA